MPASQFRIKGLDPAPFRRLFELDDAELKRRGVIRRIVEEEHSTPCRVSLEDARPGEEVLLLHHAHLDAPSPYRSGGAIYVRRAATVRCEATGVIPPMLARRLLSVRAYDDAHLMVGCDVVNGVELEGLIVRFFADPTVAYLHVHNARPGCFNCRVDRA